MVVLGSSSLSSSSVSLVMPDISSLSSSSGSMVVPDNLSSAEAEVSTTINLPDSNSNIKGLVGLGTLDEDAISRDLVRHQKRQWGVCASASCVVPSGIRPRFVDRRTRLPGRAILVAHTNTCPGNAALPA